MLPDGVPYCTHGWWGVSYFYIESTVMTSRGHTCMTDMLATCFTGAVVMQIRETESMYFQHQMLSAATEQSEVLQHKHLASYNSRGLCVGLNSCTVYVDCWFIH